jgi:hypothetical protein
MVLRDSPNRQSPTSEGPRMLASVEKTQEASGRVPSAGRKAACRARGLGGRVERPSPVLLLRSTAFAASMVQSGAHGHRCRQGCRTRREQPDSWVPDRRVDGSDCLGTRRQSAGCTGTQPVVWGGEQHPLPASSRHPRVGSVADLEGPPIPTRALVTDVGNDILYGFSAEQTPTWVEEAVSRLQRVTRDIIDGPSSASIRRLSQARFSCSGRSWCYPACSRRPR